MRRRRDQKRKGLVKHWIAIGLMALLAPAYGQDILMAEADRYRLGLGEEVRVSFRFREKEIALSPPRWAPIGRCFLGRTDRSRLPL